MFKRISYDEWVAIVPAMSFFLLAAVFVLTTVRALLMARKEREHLSTLPLQDDETPNHHSHV